MACLPGHIPVNAQTTRMDSSPDQKRFSSCRICSSLQRIVRNRRAASATRRATPVTRRTASAKRGPGFPLSTMRSSKEGASDSVGIGVEIIGRSIEEDGVRAPEPNEPGVAVLDPGGQSVSEGVFDTGAKGPFRFGASMLAVITRPLMASMKTYSASKFTKAIPPAPKGASLLSTPLT
jgi:hypothetical protein